MILLQDEVCPYCGSKNLEIKESNKHNKFVTFLEKIFKVKASFKMRHSDWGRKIVVCKNCKKIVLSINVM